MKRNSFIFHFFIFAITALFLVSCSKVERNERKFVKAMKSDNYEAASQAFDDFCNWMLNDKATLTHDFKLMREELGLSIATSKDGNLRCYSLPTNAGDNVTVYANIVQWTRDGHFVGFSGPIDKLLAGRSGNIKKRSTMAHHIDTIYQLDKATPTVYIIAQSYKNVDGKKRAYVSAAYIDGVVLRLLPFFFDGIEIAGNYEFNPDGKIGIKDLFKWDEETDRFYAYQTDDNYNVIPGKYTVYQINGDRLVRLPDDTNN